ncbi:hypothetical protein ACFLW4_00065 [Chloroflexota bacterium]
MKKQRLFIGMILFLVPLTLTGCGIAQEQYDAVVADLSKAQQELQAVKAELESSQAKVSELTASLNKTKTELDTAHAKNSELTSNLDKTNTDLEAAQTENSKLTTSLDKTNSELSSVRSEYSSFKSEAKRLFLLLDDALELNHAILGTNAEILTNDLDGVRKGCLTITTRLSDLKDLKKAEFDALWEDAYISTSQQWQLFPEPFERFMWLHTTRISDKATWLREHLLQ